MNDSEIINVLGGVPSVARMLNIKPPSVYEWLMEGKGIPEYRLRELAGQIEIMSEGRFTRKERWPDKYAFYWPELAQAQANSAQAASETVAISADALPPISDLPPIVATRTAPAWDGIDRRAPVARPLPPELERRALVGGV